MLHHLSWCTQKSLSMGNMLERKGSLEGTLACLISLSTKWDYSKCRLLVLFFKNKTERKDTESHIGFALSCEMSYQNFDFSSPLFKESVLLLYYCFANEKNNNNKKNKKVGK